MTDSDSFVSKYEPMPIYVLSIQGVIQGTDFQDADTNWIHPAAVTNILFLNAEDLMGYLEEYYVVKDLTVEGINDCVSSRKPLVLGVSTLSEPVSLYVGTIPAIVKKGERK